VARGQTGLAWPRRSKCCAKAILVEADRLGRSVKQLVDLVGDLHKHGVQFRSLIDSIDTGTIRAVLNVMASLAEMERELTVERTRAGLEVAIAARPQRRPQAEDDRQQDRSAKKMEMAAGSAAHAGWLPFCAGSSPF
jgi:DNA invertase Pin-like site-specific DNA recombinase